MLVVGLGFGLGENRAYGADPVLSEVQVKSLFLLNFAKYVEWPESAFATAEAPIVIGVLGGGRFTEEAGKILAGKSVGGRPIRVRNIAGADDLQPCHILFIHPDRAGAGQMLARIKSRPVLTVGESDQYIDQGGVINFVQKQGKIRLEINLAAARLANLQISSKLLSVADSVKGK